MPKVIDFDPRYDAGVPSVEPTPAPANDYQNIQTNPNQFGAQVGQGLEAFGQGAIKASQVWSQVASDDATNNYQSAVTKLLYGDPNKTSLGPDGQPVPDLGYMGLKGDAALRARPQIEQQLDQLLSQARSGLINTDQQLDFDRNTRRYRTYLSSQIGSHADSQANVFAGEVNKASATLALDHIARNAGSDDEFEHGTADLIRARVRQAQIAGGGPELTDQAILTGRRDAVEARVKALVPTDPAAAQRVLDANRDVLMGAGNYDALSQMIKTRGTEALGDDMLLRAARLAGGRGLSTGGAVATRISQEADQQGVDANLALTTAHIESSMGRNLGRRRNIFQLGRPEWASVGGGGMADTDTQVRNGIAFLGRTQQQLQKALGRPATPDEVYLAHQQGVAGATALLRHPDQPAGQVVSAVGGSPANISGNLGNPNAPASQFVAQWRNKFQQVAQQVGGGGASAGPTASAAGGGLDLGVGDSIAVQQIRHGVAGTEDAQNRGQPIGAGTAGVGDTPERVLRRITAAPAGSFTGKTVFLSSGASNNPQQAGLVGDQINALKNAGAANIVVPGVGPGVPNAAAVNASIKSVVEDHGATFFQPDVRWQADGVHPAEVDKVRAQATAALGKQGAPDAAAPDQLVRQPPAAGANATPAPVPPPGMADLANAEAELAQRHAQTITNLANDPRAAANPTAYAHAVQKADVDFRARQMAITAQRQAMTEAQSAALDGYVRKLAPGMPVDPSMVGQIADDPNLGAASRENLYRLIEARQKSTTEGDAAKFGPKFYEFYNRVTAPTTDPNKIRDPSQILQLAAPKADGSQDLTLAGANQLVETMKKERELTPAGEALARRKEDLLKAVSPLIDKSNPLMGKIDQEGGVKKYEFSYALDQKIDEYRAAGKDPNSLFNPASPDYMGRAESVAPFQKPLQQSLKDRARALTPAAPPPPAVVVAPVAPTQEFTAPIPPPLSPTAAPVPAPRQTAPRLPNETPAEYLRRIGAVAPSEPEPRAPIR